jgi:hypothetical protein
MSAAFQLNSLAGLPPANASWLYRTIDTYSGAPGWSSAVPYDVTQYHLCQVCQLQGKARSIEYPWALMW